MRLKLRACIMDYDGAHNARSCKFASSTHEIAAWKAGDQAAMLNLFGVAVPAAWLPWAPLLLALAYFAAISLALHRIPERSVEVTRYDPPPGISAAVAATLVNNGRSERAFAAAIVSLAAQGFIEIQESGATFRFVKLREPAPPLFAEETALMNLIFPSSAEILEFSDLDPAPISYVFSEFRGLLESAVRPSLLSAHRGLWALGVILALPAAYLAYPSFAVRVDFTSAFLVAYVIFWAILGGSCFVAALRVWPVTLHKLFSWVPEVDRPKRPLNFNDLTPIYLTAAAGMGLGFFASLTSANFALLLLAMLLILTVFHHQLEAPTRQGRKVIADLENFREFLARADSGRLDRENRPGQSPDTLERFASFAIAMNVEHAWGQEFAENLLELIQMDEAFSVRLGNYKIPERADHLESGFIQLNLRNRK